MKDNSVFYYRYIFNNFDPKHPFLQRFIKVRDTPKGVVVINEHMSSLYYHERRSKNTKENREYKRSLERFILNSSIKKYCYKTKYEALFGFIKRQESRLNILQSQLASVKEFVDFSKLDGSLERILEEYDCNDAIEKNPVNIEDLFNKLFNIND